MSSVGHDLPQVAIVEGNPLSLRKNGNIFKKRLKFA